MPKKKAHEKAAMPKKTKTIELDKAEVDKLTKQTRETVQKKLDKRFYAKYKDTLRIYNTIKKLTNPGHVPMQLWLWVLVGKVVIEGTVNRRVSRFIPDVKAKLVSTAKVPNLTKFQLQFILDMYFSFTGENLWVPVLDTEQRSYIAAPVTQGALEDKKFPRFKNVTYIWDDDKTPPELTLQLKEVDGVAGVGHFKAEIDELPETVPGDIDQRSNEDIILEMKDNLREVLAELYRRVEQRDTDLVLKGQNLSGQETAEGGGVASASSESFVRVGDSVVRVAPRTPSSVFKVGASAPDSPNYQSFIMDSPQLEGEMVIQSALKSLGSGEPGFGEPESQSVREGEDPMLQILRDTDAMTNLKSPGNTFYDIASTNPFWSMLADAIKTTGMDKVFSSGGPFTFFAPVNQGIGELGGELGKYVLQNHVLDRLVLAKELKDGDTLNTITGSKLRVNLQEGDVLINGVYVEPEPLKSDEGLIYLIDGVLMPDLPAPAGDAAVELEAVEHAAAAVKPVERVDVTTLDKDGAQKVVDALRETSESQLTARQEALLESATARSIPVPSEVFLEYAEALLSSKQLQQLAREEFETIKKTLNWWVINLEAYNGVGSPLIPQAIINDALRAQRVRYRADFEPTNLFPDLDDAEVMASLTHMEFGPPADLPAAREQAVSRQAVASEFRNIYQYGTFIKDAERISEQVSRRPHTPEPIARAAGGQTPMPFDAGASETLDAGASESKGTDSDGLRHKRFSTLKF